MYLVLFYYCINAIKAIKVTKHTQRQIQKQTNTHTHTQTHTHTHTQTHTILCIINITSTCVSHIYSTIVLACSDLSEHTLSPFEKISLITLPSSTKLEAARPRFTDTFLPSTSCRNIQSIYTGVSTSQRWGLPPPLG